MLLTNQGNNIVMFYFVDLDPQNCWFDTWATRLPFDLK